MRAARLANALVGTAIVALIGLIALQLWGRREALAALALGAIYVPLILVGQSVMSEPLFVLCLLGAIAGVLHSRGYRWVVAGGRAGRPGDPRPRQRDHPARAAGLGGLATAAGPRAAGRAGRGGGADRRAVDDPQRGDAARLRAGLDPVRLRAGGDVQQRGARGQGQPGVVADAEARRRLPPDLQPDPQHLRAGARAAAAQRVDRVHQGPPGLRADGRLLDDAPDARPRRDGLVDPHRGDDLARPAAGRSRA